MGKFPTNHDEAFYLKYTIGILKDGRKTRVSAVQTSGTVKLYSDLPTSGNTGEHQAVRHYERPSGISESTEGQTRPTKQIFGRGK